MLERVFAATARFDAPYEPAAIQTDILALFAEVLKRHGIRPDDDFFDLGGDSLNAVNVMAAIEAKCDVSLPVSAILEAPTARLLALLVDEARDNGFDSCVIRVQEAGSGAPVVVVHGISGDVRYARDISKILGPTRPVYGLRAVGLRAGETPISTIPDIAARYVSDLRRVRPSGPYFVHGYCGGAFIAYEIAQQLKQAGDDVQGLIIVDPPLDWRRTPFLVTSGGVLKLLKRAAGLRYRWAEFRSLFRIAKSDRYRRILVARTLWNALAHYVPEPWPSAALILYCPEQRDIILNPTRGLKVHMPAARLLEFGDTHISLFQKAKAGPSVLAETKAFIERLDPA
jgi:acyl carrier protein